MYLKNKFSSQIYLCLKSKDSGVEEMFLHLILKCKQQNSY